MNQLADNLRAAKALIDTPEKWTKGAFARGRHGFSVDVSSPIATCFCLRGAVHAVTGNGRRTRDVFSALERAVGRRGLAQWNDRISRTHADVMAAFDQAIAAAESISDEDVRALQREAVR